MSNSSPRQSVESHYSQTSLPVVAITHTTKGADFLNPPPSNPHAQSTSKYTPVDDYSLSSSPVSNHDVDAGDLKGSGMSHSLSNEFDRVDNANGIPTSDSFMANASAPMEEDPETATAEYEEAAAAAAAEEEPAIIESPAPKYTPIDDSPVEASASESNSISPPAVISSTSSNHASLSPTSPPPASAPKSESRATRFANYIRRKKEEHDRESREKKEKKEREKQEKKQRELAEKAAQQQQREELDEQKHDSSSAPSSAPSSSSNSLLSLLRSVGGSNSEKKPSGSSSNKQKKDQGIEKGSKKNTPQSPLSSESADEIESDEGSSSSGGGGGSKRSLYTQQLIHLSQSVLNFFNRSSASSSNPAALFGSQPHSFTNSPAWILGRVYKLLAGTNQLANSAASSSSSSAGAPNNGGVMSIAQAQASALQLRRARFHSEWRTLLWSTYRKDFPAIGSSAYRSDAGWGCMIRSAQMMLGQVFMRHWLGRDWRRPLVRRAGKKHRIKFKHHENDLTQSESEHEEDNHSQHQHEYASLPPLYLKLLGLFFDSPSASSPYSIHNLLLRGQTSKDKKIGEWFGPHQACCMMMNMMENELEKKRKQMEKQENHETGHTQLEEEDEAVQGFGSDDVQRMSGSVTGHNGELESANSVESMHYTPSPSPNDSPLAAASTAALSPSNSAIPPLFTVPKVYLSDDGTLYRDRILELATGSADGGASNAEIEQQTDGADQAFRGRSSSYTAPAAQVNLDSHEFPAPSPPHFTAAFHPLLLLIPLRLGVDRINPSYLPSLLSVFQFPQCVGVIGGRPRASLYFVGVQDARLFYLDPHTVQRSYDLSGEHSLRQGSIGAQHEIESTYHCDAVRSIAADSIDPSLAIGFYIENRRSLEEFWEQAKQLNEAANLLHAHHAALNHANVTPSSSTASANQAAAQAAAALLPVFHVADVSPNYEGLDSDPDDDADDEDLEGEEDEGSDLDASAVVDADTASVAEAEEGVDDEQSEFDVARAVSEKDLTSSPVLCAKQAEPVSAHSATLDDDALEGGSLLGESAVSNEGVPNPAGMSASAVASSIHASAASISDFTYSLSSAAASHLTSGATKLTSLTQSLASQAQGGLAQLAVHAQSMTQASVAAAARKFSGENQQPTHPGSFEQMTGSNGAEHEEEMVNMSREGDIPISPMTATSLPNSASDLDSVVVSDVNATEANAAPVETSSIAATPVRPHLNTAAAASSSTPISTPVASASASTPSSSAASSTPLNRAGSGRRTTKAARKSSRASQRNAQQEDEFVFL